MYFPDADPERWDIPEWDPRPLYGPLVPKDYEPF